MISHGRSLEPLVALLVAASALGPLACGSAPDEPAAARPAGSQAAAPARAGGANLYGLEVARTCAGFGPGQAAKLLGVAAGAVVDTSRELSPTLRMCTFTQAGDESRAVSFSLEHEDSVEDAAGAYAAMRDNIPLAERAQKEAGVESDDSALIEISGLGDEALWTNVNGTLTVRRANLTIQVMAPRERRQQIAVAQAVLALLP